MKVIINPYTLKMIVKYQKMSYSTTLKVFNEFHRFIFGNETFDIQIEYFNDLEVSVYPVINNVPQYLDMLDMVEVEVQLFEQCNL